MERDPARPRKIPFYRLPFLLVYIAIVAIVAAILFPIYQYIPLLRPAIRRLGKVFAPISRLFGVGEPDPDHLLRK